MAVKSIVECVEEGTTKFKIDCLIYQLLQIVCDIIKSQIFNCCKSIIERDEERVWKIFSVP